MCDFHPCTSDGFAVFFAPILPASALLFDVLSFSTSLVVPASANSIGAVASFAFVVWGILNVLVDEDFFFSDLAGVVAGDLVGTR